MSLKVTIYRKDGGALGVAQSPEQRTGLNTPNLPGTIARLKTPDPWIQAAGEATADNVRSHWVTQQGPTGPWAKNDPVYAKQKAKRWPGAGILEASGRMFASVDVHISPRQYRVNAWRVSYAKFHGARTGREWLYLSRDFRENLPKSLKDYLLTGDPTKALRRAR